MPTPMTTYAQAGCTTGQFYPRHSPWQNLLTVIFCASLAGACSNPMGPVPGGKLDGELTPWPEDWSFTDSIENILLETNPSNPYSVTLWGVSHDGSFYVAAGDPDSRWVEHIAANSSVVIGIQEKLYTARAYRLADIDVPPGLLQAYVDKYEIEPEQIVDDDENVIFVLQPRN